MLEESGRTTDIGAIGAGGERVYVIFTRTVKSGREAAYLVHHLLETRKKAVGRTLSACSWTGRQAVGRPLSATSLHAHLLPSFLNDFKMSHVVFTASVPSLATVDTSSTVKKKEAQFAFR